jgi:predicted HTH domain antitoxin
MERHLSGQEEAMTTLTFPKDLLVSTNMTQQEIATELAIALYQREKLSVGQAASLAGMGKSGFMHLLASRDIPLNLDVSDLEKDIANLRALGRL